MSPTNLFPEVLLMPLWDKHELHTISQTIHVNRNSVLCFCTYSSLSTLYIPVHILPFILFLHVLIKIVTWLTQCRGVSKYLGESVVVCSWGCHFSLHKKGWPDHLLWHSHLDQLLPLSWPAACTDFPAKTNCDVIRASCGEIPIM